MPAYRQTGMIGLMPHLVPDRHPHEMAATCTGASLRRLHSVFGDGPTCLGRIAEAAGIPAGAEGLPCLPITLERTAPP